MKITELLEATDKQTEQTKQRAQAMMDELVKTFKLAKGKDTYIQMFGAHSPISIAKFSIALPSSLKDDDLEFAKRMVDKHAMRIVKKYFPDIEERELDLDIGEKPWYEKRVFYRALDIPKTLRKKFNGVIDIRTAR